MRNIADYRRGIRLVNAALDARRPVCVGSDRSSPCAAILVPEFCKAGIDQFEGRPVAVGRAIVIVFDRIDRNPVRAAFESRKCESFTRVVEGALEIADNIRDARMRVGERGYVLAHDQVLAWPDRSAERKVRGDPVIEPVGGEVDWSRAGVI